MKYVMKKLRRILALALAVAVLAPVAPAMAESYRAVVTGGALTVYARSNLSGAHVTIPAYSVVKVKATQGNVAMLQNGSYIGYANLGMLTRAGTSTAVTNRVTRVFQYPTLYSASVAIPKGFSMNLLYTNGTYAIVENKGVIAYALSAHLTTQNNSSSGGSSSGNSNGITYETYQATVVVQTLPVYSSASASSTYLGSLTAGAGVTVYAQNANWAYIGKSGHFGFCALAGLERGQGQGGDFDELANAVKVNVTASTMKVYKSADKSSQLLGTLQKGTQVNLIATEGLWAYIELNGRYGFCLISAITNATGSDGSKGETIGSHAALGTATVIKAYAPVYAAMSTSAQYSVLRMGETVSYYGYDSNWVLVGRDGVFGFMPSSYLSTVNYASLRQEDSGAGVVQLENELLELGYLDSIPSANYTAITAAAVSRLQAAVGMNQTGKADIATLRVLLSGSAPTSPILNVTLAKGSKNSNVSRLQNRLLALGYLSRESSVDGDYGTNTAAAVQLFQTAAGLSATGTADSKTIRALYKPSAPRLGSGKSPADQSSSSGSSSSGSSSGSSGNTTNIPSGLASNTSSYYAGMSNAQKLEYVIYVAQQQLGKRYVFGAAGPSTFDCSGLMMYCFGKIGIQLQHSAKGEGYNDARPKISSKASLVRGDMVFFNTVSDGDMCDHVGIYLGNNYCLHAGSGAGKVIISTIASGYYSRVFSWGRRVLNT